MTTSKWIKDSAAAAKRASTAIKTVIAASSRDAASELSAKDKDILEKASLILARVGAAKSQAAAKAKRVEDEYARLYRSALASAKLGLNNRNLREAPLDIRVAFIVGSGNGHLLERQDADIPAIKGETRAERWRDLLQHALEFSIEEMAESIAHNVASKRAIAGEALTTTFSQLDAIKGRPRVQALLRDLQDKLQA